MPYTHTITNGDGPAFTGDIALRYKIVPQPPVVQRRGTKDHKGRPIPTVRRLDDGRWEALWRINNTSWVVAHGKTRLSAVRQFRRVWAGRHAR